MKKLIPLLTLILLGGIYYFLRPYFTPQSADINLIAAPSPSPYVALTFEPYFLTLPANTTSKLGITVSMSPEFTAKTARLEIAFNSNCISPTLSSADVFPRLSRPVEVENGVIRATFTTGANPISDFGIIAYVTTGPKGSGNCELNFTNKTAILNSDNTNILTSTTPATLKLKTSGPSMPPFKQPDYIRDR